MAHFQIDRIRIFGTHTQFTSFSFSLFAKFEIDAFRLGIYQGIHLEEAPKSTEHNGTQGAQQQPLSARLSGSDIKSTNRIDAFCGGLNSSSVSIGGGMASSTAGGGESPTPPLAQRRLAKSFSVAPSNSQKGALNIYVFNLYFIIIYFSF